MSEGGIDHGQCPGCEEDISTGERFVELPIYEARTEHWNSVDGEPNQKPAKNRMGNVRVHEGCLSESLDRAVGTESEL